jgi:uncharacterized cupredoxin-like copper-binding protein
MPTGRPARRSSAPAVGQAVFVTALALIVVGCSVPSASLSGGSATIGSPEMPREINVIMRDYLFEPDPIVLHRGETVRFNVIDAGLLAHEFVLGDASVQAAWASAEAAATPPGFTATPPPVSVSPEQAGLRIFLESGQTASVAYVVPADHDLELACQIPGHVAQGMVGRIVLVGAEGP